MYFNDKEGEEGARKYGERFGWKFSNMFDLRMLAQKKKRRPNWDWSCKESKPLTVGAMDHASYYKRGPVPVAIVGQPYIGYDMKDLSRVCDLLGLMWGEDRSRAGWHNSAPVGSDDPGMTVLLVITRPEDWPQQLEPGRYTSGRKSDADNAGDAGKVH